MMAGAACSQRPISGDQVTCEEQLAVKVHHELQALQLADTVMSTDLQHIEARTVTACSKASQLWQDTQLNPEPICLPPGAP
jgi:hypothetical protein